MFVIGAYAWTEVYNTMVWTEIKLGLSSGYRSIRFLLSGASPAHERASIRASRNALLLT